MLKKKVNGFTVKTNRHESVKIFPFLFHLVNPTPPIFSSAGYVKRDKQNEFEKYCKIRRLD